MHKVRRIFHLTSPLMHGEGVEIAQRRLKGLGESKFENFHPGEVDGEYGINSAHAAKRAKYFLGFPKSKINKNYGPALDALITGRKPLPALYKLRRKRRLAKLNSAVAIRKRALSLALSQVGTKESPPSSNIVKYSKWYGIQGPWCAMFVTWCYVMAGSKNAFKQGSRWAFTPFMTSDARARRNGLRAITWAEMQPGDIVLYDWEDDRITDHVGIMVKKTSVGTFQACEGNTAIGNNSNGGQVMVRDRSISQVICFARVEHP